MRCGGIGKNDWIFCGKQGKQAVMFMRVWIL